MRKIIEFSFTVIFIVTLVFFQTPHHSTAQGDTDPELPVVYLCLDPIGTAGSLDAYLIGFAEATTLGFIPAQPATVTVYAPPELEVSVTIYDVTPDATTGGFRRGASIAQAQTRPSTPSTCGTQYGDWLEDTFNTVALDMSLDVEAFNQTAGDSSIPVALRTPTHRAVLVQVGNDPALDEEPVTFLGAAAFHFFSAASGSLGDQAFQILQLTPGAVQLTFPFLAVAYAQMTEQNRFASTPFALLTNKVVTIRRRFTGQFLEQRVSDIYPDYLEVLEGELGLPIKDIIQRRQFTVFPGWGLIENAPHLGFIRLALSATPATRQPAFTPGARVAPLDAIANIEAKYYPLDRPINLDRGALGSLKGGDGTLEVVRIDDTTGHLIVKDPNGKEVIIQAWLVHVVSP